VPRENRLAALRNGRARLGVSVCMRWAAPFLAFGLIGCTGGGDGTGHSSASPTYMASPDGTASGARTSQPAASPVPLGTLPLGIVVKDFLVEGGPTYTVSLVGIDGRVAATATGAKRGGTHTLVQMPNISASDSRLYYLDGDSKVMFLRPDRTTGLATTIPLDSNSAAVFAISPDDTRIAVAVITFPYPAKTRIYVENLSGGGNHVELFSSSAVIEWPLGWHQGHLVIGVGINSQPQNAYEGFAYGYRGFHVADATSGARISTVCDGYSSSAPPVRAGTVCTNGTANLVSDWSGTTRVIPTDEGWGGGALSPDGSLIAECQGTPRAISLVSRGGSTTATGYAGGPAGWIDANHLVVWSAAADLTLGILDRDSHVVTPIQAQGFFGGAIPGGL
jgi:hypothetical protein